MMEGATAECYAVPNAPGTIAFATADLTESTGTE